jgi:hypothetical protein
VHPCDSRPRRGGARCTDPARNGCPGDRCRRRWLRRCHAPAADPHPTRRAGVVQRYQRRCAPAAHMSSLLPGEGRARARWLPRHGRQPSHPTRPVLLSPGSSTAGGLSPGVWPGVVARTMGQLLRDRTIIPGCLVTILRSQRERRGRPLLGQTLRGRHGFTPSMASLPWSSQRAWSGVRDLDWRMSLWRRCSP